MPGFVSSEHEKTMMLSYPKLWRDWVKKYGHHRDFHEGNKVNRNHRRVGGPQKSSRRRVLKYGRKS